jgi:surfactin synthase thioesterase subunit
MGPVLGSDQPSRSDFAEALENLINTYTSENESDTPDFILAEYMMNALHAFELASRAREDWYGHRHEPGGENP